MESLDIDPAISMLVALGTSLAIIIPTSFSGAYRHFKSNNNIIKPGVKLGIFGMFGSLIGGQLATILPTEILQFIFGIFLVFIAIYNFITLNEPEVKAKIKFNIVNSFIIGSLIGVLSGLLGVGGGIFLIVVLTALLGFAMVDAVGISSVYICLTAIGGVSSYIFSGWGVNTFPYSIGYISIVNLLFIAMFSIPLAYFGATVSHKIPEKKLKKIFSVVLVYIGLRMIGLLP